MEPRRASAGKRADDSSRSKDFGSETVSCLFIGSRKVHRVKDESVADTIGADARAKTANWRFLWFFFLFSSFRLSLQSEAIDIACGLFTEQQ